MPGSRETNLSSPRSPAHPRNPLTTPSSSSAVSSQHSQAGHRMFLNANTDHYSRQIHSSYHGPPTTSSGHPTTIHHHLSSHGIPLSPPAPTTTTATVSAPGGTAYPNQPGAVGTPVSTGSSRRRQGHSGGAGAPTTTTPGNATRSLDPSSSAGAATGSSATATNQFYQHPHSAGHIHPYPPAPSRSTGSSSSSLSQKHMSGHFYGTTTTTTTAGAAGSDRNHGHGHYHHPHHATHHHPAPPPPPPNPNPPYTLYSHAGSSTAAAATTGTATATAASYHHPHHHHHPHGHPSSHHQSHHGHHGHHHGPSPHHHGHHHSHHSQSSHHHNGHHHHGGHNHHGGGHHHQGHHGHHHGHHHRHGHRSSNFLPSPSFDDVFGEVKSLRHGFDTPRCVTIANRFVLIVGSYNDANIRIWDSEPQFKKYQNIPGHRVGLSHRSQSSYSRDEHEFEILTVYPNNVKPQNHMTVYVDSVWMETPPHAQPHAHAHAPGHAYGYRGSAFGGSSGGGGSGGGGGGGGNGPFGSKTTTNSRAQALMGISPSSSSSPTGGGADRTNSSGTSSSGLSSKSTKSEWHRIVSMDVNHMYILAFNPRTRETFFDESMNDLRITKTQDPMTERWVGLHGCMTGRSTLVVACEWTLHLYDMSKKVKIAVLRKSLPFCFKFGGIVNAEEREVDKRCDYSNSVPHSRGSSSHHGMGIHDRVARQMMNQQQSTASQQTGGGSDDDASGGGSNKSKENGIYRVIVFKENRCVQVTFDSKYPRKSGSSSSASSSVAGQSLTVSGTTTTTGVSSSATSLNKSGNNQMVMQPRYQSGSSETTFPFELKTLSSVSEWSRWDKFAFVHVPSYRLIIAMGGYDAKRKECIDGIYVYDIESNRWIKSKIRLPVALKSFACVLTHHHFENGSCEYMLHIIGGCTYDPSQRRWLSHPFHWTCSVEKLMPDELVHLRRHRNPSGRSGISSVSRHISATGESSRWKLNRLTNGSSSSSSSSSSATSSGLSGLPGGTTAPYRPPPMIASRGFRMRKDGHHENSPPSSSSFSRHHHSHSHPHHHSGYSKTIRRILTPPVVSDRPTSNRFNLDLDDLLENDTLIQGIDSLSDQLSVKNAHGILEDDHDDPDKSSLRESLLLSPSHLHALETNSTEAMKHYIGAEDEKDIIPAPTSVIIDHLFEKPAPNPLQEPVKVSDTSTKPLELVNKRSFIEDGSCGGSSSSSTSIPSLPPTSQGNAQIFHDSAGADSKGTTITTPEQSEKSMKDKGSPMKNQLPANMTTTTTPSTSNGIDLVQAPPPRQDSLSPSDKIIQASIDDHFKAWFLRAFSEKYWNYHQLFVESRCNDMSLVHLISRERLKNTVGITHSVHLEFFMIKIEKRSKFVQFLDHHGWSEYLPILNALHIFDTITLRRILSEENGLAGSEPGGAGATQNGPGENGPSPSSTTSTSSSSASSSTPTPPSYPGSNKSGPDRDSSVSSSQFVHDFEPAYCMQRLKEKIDSKSIKYMQSILQASHGSFLTIS